jgi:hypothetical protein
MSRVYWRIGNRCGVGTQRIISGTEIKKSSCAPYRWRFYHSKSQRTRMHRPIYDRSEVSGIHFSA